MESAAKFMGVLAPSSLWLAGSGLVMWIYLRSRLRLSPGTRAVASMLIVLQGWIWVGIPVQLDPAWIPSQSTAIPSQGAALLEAADARAPLPFDSRLLFAASTMPHVMPMVGAVAATVWLAGIAIILWRSI